MVISLKKAGSAFEFATYIFGNAPTIEKSLNGPSLFDVSILPTEAAELSRGDYITVSTSTNSKYWTGYITNVPELEYLGSDSNNLPKWGYKYQATSDEYVLNLNPVGFVPPFLNTTQGAILINLAERLCPGLFDTTNVDDGETVARYVVDPTKTFSEIAFEFAESAYYSFRCQDFKLYFNQVDDITPALIINCNTTPTNRVNIQSSTNAAPIVITAAGHGLSNGDFVSVHGHLVNTAANGNWEIAGVSGSTFQLVNSVGNGVGSATGMVGKFNPHFTPANLKLDAEQNHIVNDCIVLGDVEPSTYVTEYFVGDGYTARFPLLSSIYGIEGAVLLDEGFSGAEVDENKWTEVDTLSDYIRVDSGYLNVIGGGGDIGTVYLQSTSPIPLEGSLRLTHGEFDFVGESSGVIAGLWTGAPVASLAGCLYGIQCGDGGIVSTVASTNLHPIIKGVVDTTQELIVTSSSRYIIRTIVSTDEVFRRLQRYRFKRSNGTVGEYGGTGTPNQLVFETYITEIDPNTGAVIEQTVWRNPSSLNESQLYALYTPAASNDLHVTISNITLSVPMQVELETLARDAWVPQLSQYSILDGTPVPFDLTMITGWTKKIVGPNEIDSFDGLSPAATITVSGRGKVDRANPLSTPKYNPGDAALEFFKDSTKMQTNIPGPGDIIRIRYRRASVAVGRALNSTSIASEALAWGDDGYRTLTKRDANPAPRTSFECELAAAAIVEELGFQHYEGTYTQDSHFEFTGNPLPGTVLKFANLAPTMPSDLDTELITAVKTTFASSSQEGFTHEVTFGQPDRLKKLLSGMQRPIGEFYKEDTATIPNAADLAGASTQIGSLNLLWYSTVLNYTNFGTSAFVPATYLDAVRLPYLVSWHNDFFDSTLSTFTIYTNTAPPAGGGFEVRYTDAGWGTTNNKNLISSGASQTFTIPKTNRYNGDYCFIRAYDSTGKYSRYSTAIRILWPGVPGPSSGINTVGGTAAHPVFQATLTTDTGNESGIPDLVNDIWGIEAGYAHQISLNGTWFYRNGASAGASYIANAGSNPGPFNITLTEPTGLVYTIKTVTLPGNADVTQSGFINMEPIDKSGVDIPLSTVDAETVATFFVWVKGNVGDKLRLNIKDDLAPDASPVPYGFYSRTDYTLPDSGWHPLFTRAKIARNTAGNFNVVIHNIGTASATINYCIESLGIAFYDYADITLGASTDSPGLLFNYENSVRKEVYVPIGVFFYNTVNDYSRYAIELQSASPTAGVSDGDDWINVVRDMGVLGDGTDETTKIQTALDAAGDGSLGKIKVLIPSGITVIVSPQFIDNCMEGYWGPMWVCLFIDSGVTLRIDGTLKIARPTAEQLDLGGAAVIANRNSFRAISGRGTTAAYNNTVPVGFTGDTQGLLNSGAHNNNSAGTTITFTGSPDLSGVSAGEYIPFPTNLYRPEDPSSPAPMPLRLGVVASSGIRMSEIVSVDNTAKTITCADSFNAIASGSPKSWFIENNYVDENITIEGVGTIDCDNHVGDEDWDWVFAFRMCRCRRLTIRGIRILDADEEMMEIVLSEYVRIQNVDFELTDIENAWMAYDLSLDVCSYVWVENCNFILPKYTEGLLFTASGANISGLPRVGTIGIFAWATRNLTVRGCSYKNHMAGSSFSGIVGFVQLQGYGQNVLEGHGTIWGFFDETEDNRIIWNMAKSVGDGSTPADTFIGVDWNLLIDGNVIQNNAGGLTLLGETFFGMPGKGIKVVNNTINNNEGYGIGLGVCDKIIIAHNSIKSNGWANAAAYFFD